MSKFRSYLLYSERVEMCEIIRNILHFSSAAAVIEVLQESLPSGNDYSKAMKCWFIQLS